jgi:hypothetical protein
MEDVGCDPENYGYEEELCGTACDEDDFIYGGCNGTYWASRKGQSFDDMDLVVSGDDWKGDDSSEGYYPVCMYDCECRCKEVRDAIGEVIGYTCYTAPLEECFFWEEWRPDFLDPQCIDPDDPDFS